MHNFALFTLIENASDCDSFAPHYIGQDNPWMTFLEDNVFESEEYLFLELHATAMLCLPSGECLRPDATVCAALMSALYSSVSEEVVLDRQLMVFLPMFLFHMFLLPVIIAFNSPMVIYT